MSHFQKHLNVTSEKTFREPSDREQSLDFKFMRREPGVFIAKMESGREIIIEHPDRSTAYILCAAAIHGVPFPVKPELTNECNS
jgi:hypothetical protein